MRRSDQSQEQSDTRPETQRGYGDTAKREERRHRVIRSRSRRQKMRTELVILLAGAVVATFVNLVWETLDYGFPDDLAKPEDDKERKSTHLAE